jgi:hypothetical protein
MRAHVVQTSAPGKRRRRIEIESATETFGRKQRSPLFG